MATIYRGHIPFVRFVLAFAAGIGLAYAIEASRSVYVTAWVVFGLTLSVFALISWYTRFREHHLYGILGLFVFLALAVAGFLRTWSSHPAIDQNHFSHGDAKALVGYIADEPTVSGYHVRFPLVITHSYGEGGAVFREGKLMLTINAGDSVLASSRLFSYGDELILPARYQIVPPPFNPKEMDYRAYLANNDMWHQAYLYADQVKTISQGKGNIIKARALAIRHQMTAIFSRYLPDREAQAISSTLILGDRSVLSEETLRTFSATGTIHVLSVSGMHVVIVSWLLSRTLWWMDRNRLLRTMRLMILLLGIWGYALLTGFSPPVLRASIMITFVMAAPVFRQQSRTFNSIAASAFFLLMYDPKYIADIGFQLSYLAVSGIVLLHPMLKRALPVKKRFAGPIVDYLLLSVAAQVGAGPLAAYYFHQFPLYFLPANLVVVLPASLIMYLGFGLLLLPGGQLATWVGQLLNQLISWTVKVLGHIEQLPLATVRGIWLTWWDEVFIYLLLAAIGFTFATKEKRWLHCALVCATSLAISSFSRSVKAVGRHEVVIFNVRRNLAIGLVGERQAWLYSNLVSPDDGTLRYSVLPELEAKVDADAIRRIPYDSTFRDPMVYANAGVLQFGNSRILISEGKIRYGGHLKVDILLLRNNPRLSLRELTENIHCRMLVIDGSNSDQVVNRLTAEAAEAGIPLYVLKDNFAYVWTEEARTS